MKKTEIRVQLGISSTGHFKHEAFVPVSIRVSNLDGRLRQANFVTLDSDYCSDEPSFPLNPDSILCAFSNDDNNQSIYDGDSGIYLYCYTI